MHGKSLPHFTDELRVRIGGKQVGAETGLLSGLFARGPPRGSIAYREKRWHGARCLASVLVKLTI
jgi:hypothetical protein